MDVLSEVLHAVRLNGAAFFDIDAAAPWAVASSATREVRDRVMPASEHLMSFHLVLDGSGWIEAAGFGLQPAPIKRGDVIVMPGGDPHYLSSEPGIRVLPEMQNYYRPRDQQLPFKVSAPGGGSRGIRIVCGYFGCDATPFNPLLDALPRLAIIKADPESAGAVSTLIAAALTESERRRPGSETVLAKLSELMLVEALRLHIEALPESSEGWLGGLRDPLVGRALQLIHGDPSNDWTLASLARATGSSRSVLADRFSRQVKHPPMQYLARWRMQLATHALMQQRLSIACVASEVGYESEAAFNRAFKRVVGVPPGLWRRSRRDAA